MKIGMLGTRGIPNHYGGFEECAAQLAPRLVSKGHQVYVYNSHRHPYQHKTYQGAHIIHKYDPEHRMGTAGQFLYDLNCLVDAQWRHFDVVLMFGYTSSSVWYWLAPKSALLVTNMDGLEWKRSKYSGRVQRFLKYAEKWAANKSDLMIADSKGIATYLSGKYRGNLAQIAYGAEIPKNPDASLLDKYGVAAFNYHLLVARLEPENHIATILEGVVKSKRDRITLVVGNYHTPYGQELQERFKDSRIRFIQGVYDKAEITALRYFSSLFFHGHSVGGTNPSLLEAMACKNMIVAHRNTFNQEVLGEDGNYFLDANDVANSIDLLERDERQEEMIKSNLDKIKMRYNWEVVADQYEVALQQGLL
jgi:glycosyltransferase involved in cell wall biosynthesis